MAYLYRKCETPNFERPILNYYSTDLLNASRY